MGPTVQWRRLKSYSLNDYFYLSDSSYDAVTFIPQIDIFFTGFGVFSNYHQKDMTYMVKVPIND